LETHLKSVHNQLNGISTLLSNITSDYNSKISNIKSLCQCTDISSEIANKISALENKIPSLPLSPTNVNYRNDSSIIKAVQTRLRELDDNISFLISHVNDISTLEDAIIKMQINIPTLPISASQVNCTNVNNYITTLDIYLNTLTQDLLNLQTTISNLLTSFSGSTILPISASDVNYTKTDENIVSLDSYLKDIVNDIQAIGEHVNKLFDEANIHTTHICS
jgi:hypothetical protein